MSGVSVLMFFSGQSYTRNDSLNDILMASVTSNLKVYKPVSTRLEVDNNV